MQNKMERGYFQKNERLNPDEKKWSLSSMCWNRFAAAAAVWETGAPWKWRLPGR